MLTVRCRSKNGSACCTLVFYTVFVILTIFFLDLYTCACMHVCVFVCVYTTDTYIVLFIPLTWHLMCFYPFEMFSLYDCDKRSILKCTLYDLLITCISCYVLFLYDLLIACISCYVLFLYDLLIACISCYVLFLYDLLITCISCYVLFLYDLLITCISCYVLFLYDLLITCISCYVLFLCTVIKSPQSTLYF